MSNAPLTGLLVVDCARGLAGQQAAGLLADYGADVVWVEPGGGSPSRRNDPPAAAVFNRGKRSIVLDLQNAADRETLQALVARADVLVEDGAADIGAVIVHAANERLVHARIGGMDPDGPHGRLPPYEPLVHAAIGTMAAQAGHREGPIFQGLPFATTGAAQLAVLGVLAALYRRAADGAGRRVETSLWDGALAFHSMLWGESDASNAKGAPQITGRAMGGASKNRLVTRSFQCADGEYIGVHTGALGAFGRLMDVLGLADRIPPVESKVDMGVPLTPEQADILEREIHAIFAAHPRAYWVDRLMKADVCAVEHLRPGDVFDQPQARCNDMVVTLDDAVLGRIEQTAPGIRFNAAPPKTPERAPTPDEHGAAIRAELKAPAVSPWRARLPATAKPDPRPLLHDVKIVDLGAYYAGPFSSRLLADLGADVIKVEPTIGDQLRGIERPFFAAQAGKRSLAANLKSEGLARAVEKLMRWADIVHHNMRPGAAERLGLGVDQVRKHNSNLIYLYAPGWGSGGPHKMRQSFAPMLSGFVGASYEVAGEFNEPLPSVGNEDPGNGLLGAIAMLLALLHRGAAGEALFCENPQLNAAMGMMAHVVRNSDGAALGAGRLDVLQMGTSALERLYETNDGFICIAAREDAEIAALARATGVRIMEDPRFATPDARAENRDALEDALRTAFAGQASQAWLAALNEMGAPAVIPADSTRLRTIMHDPHERAMGRVAEVTHAELGQVREIAKLVRISDAEIVPHRLAPGLGEHSEEILTWLGYSEAEIASLRARGDVR